MATRTTAKPATRPPARPRAVEFPRHLVTAVLVAHDGAAWLPETLAALQWQRRPPQRVVAVDTGSVDDTRRILDRELGASSVLDAPRTTGYGAAIALALDAYVGAPEAPVPGRIDDGETVEWIWLLHDDCAPSPDALRHLLALGEDSPSAAVIGPKVHAWDDPRVLIEVGFSVDTSGRRETGLERREIDQGQHDAVRDVLAVGTAGALIRRDVWDALGGFDHELPLFRDDLDFCWRVNLAGHRVCVAPQATVRHAEAATAHRRHLAATMDRQRRVDRAHALYTLLVDLSGAGLFITVPRLLIGSLLRALAFLLTKRVGDAADEVAALATVLAHPGHIVAGRRRRAATRELPHHSARRLLARRSTRLRHNFDVAASWLAERGMTEESRARSALETGPGVADDDFDEGKNRIVRRLLLRPAPLLLVGLTVVALIAQRHLLGPGALVGGRLLPPGGGASDLWDSFASSWHTVGTGAGGNAPPYLAALALFATVLLGKAWLAVDVVMLGCVPLAGLAAYLALGRVTRQWVLRVWAAATYALLPVATGIIASGRLGDAVAFIAIPPLFASVARLVRTDPWYDGWRHVGGCALLLAVASAFAPVLYLVALPILLGAIVVVRLAAPPTTRGAAIRRTFAVVLVAAAPIALLWPWSQTVMFNPGLLLTTPGPAVSGLTAARLRPAELLLAHPGGPGMPILWLTVPVLAAGLSGLVRRSRRGFVYALWGVALIALAAGIVVAHIRVATLFAGPAGTVVGWPGVPTAVFAAALLTVAVIAADGARERLARMSFGWRQPLAGLIAVSAALVPLATGVAFLARSAGDPLQRANDTVIPAFAAAESLSGVRPNILSLRTTGSGGLSFALLRGRPPQIGDGDVTPRASEQRDLRVAVADLAAARGDRASAALATYGIRYVLMPDPVDPRLEATLDTTVGLSRRTTGGSGAIWQLTAPVGRLVVLPASGAATAVSATAPPTGGAPVTPTAVLPAGPVAARADIPPGEPGRLLVLAESTDRGWRAEVAGQRLAPQKAWGWAQAFALPPGGGPLHVWHSSARHSGALAIEGVLVALVIVLAMPSSTGASRRRDDRRTTEAAR